METKVDARVKKVSRRQSNQKPEELYIPQKPIILPFVTSRNRPEIKIRPKCWGANKRLLLPPFQVVIVTDGKADSRLEGTTTKTIQVCDKQAIVRNSIEYGCFFYPNDVTTRLKRSNKKDGGSFFKRVVTEGGPFPIANIYFCYVDIECKTDDQRWTALEALESADPAPTTIVKSGNGFHGYWSVEPTALLRFKNPNERQECVLKFRIFRAIQRLLTKKFDSDKNVGHNKRSSLRVPDTTNIKNSVITKCEYFSGELERDRANPKYTLESLFDLLVDGEIPANTSAIDRIADLRKPATPRIKLRRGKAALSKWIMLKGAFSSTKFNKADQRYFEYLYANRDLRFFVAEKILAKLNGKQLRAARTKFISLGLVKTLPSDESGIKQVFPDGSTHRYSPARGRAIQYELADQFFTLLGEKRSEPRTTDTVASISEGTYDRGERNTGISRDFRKLRSLGVSINDCERIITEKVSRRGPGLEWKLDTLHALCKKARAQEATKANRK